jgi:hypothetical protein
MSRAPRLGFRLQEPMATHFAKWRTARGLGVTDALVACVAVVLYGDATPPVQDERLERRRRAGHQ